MKVSQLRLAGIALIELDLHGDGRGFFVERFNEHRFRHHGLPSYFCQDNHSRSVPGTLRGLHYQAGPPQGKLVGVIRGSILDVVVDIRPNVTDLWGSSGDPAERRRRLSSLDPGRIRPRILRDGT